MKQKIIRQLTLMGAAFIVITISGCGGNGNQNNTENERQISVKGEIVTTSTHALKKNYTGTLEGEKQAVISSKMAEAVDKVLVAEGDKVKADDVLIMLDRTGPTSNYVQAQSVYKNSEKNFNKMKYLYDQGAISESQFDGAKTDYEVSQANFNSARDLVDITSPISGMVTSLDVHPGDYLSPGQTVATVASTGKLRMKFGVNTSDVIYFDKGDLVTVYVESGNRIQSKGKVLAVARSADPVTRTFEILVEVDNQGGKLKPGMFARAEIVLENFENIMTVPADAIIIRENIPTIFTLTNGVVNAVQVKTGAEFDGFTQVVEGVNPGDTVITVGQDYIDDGFKVKLVRLMDENGKEIEL